MRKILALAETAATMKSNEEEAKISKAELMKARARRLKAGQESELAKAKLLTHSSEGKVTKLIMADQDQDMAGLGDNPVQFFSTGRANHWEFLRLWTGFELPRTCPSLPGYASNLNRSGLDFMRWSQIDIGAQDLNGIQRPKSFTKCSWK
jgi:hypothetical protein